MSEPKLMACPFCGAQPTDEGQIKHGNNCYLWYLIRDEIDSAVIWDDFHTEWNTRHSATEGWRDGVPDVAPGSCKRVLVTVEFKNGKRSVRQASYANAYWIEWSDNYDPPENEVDEDGGKKWTGWIEDREDITGDPVVMEIEGTVIAWQPLPPPAVKQSFTTQEADGRG